MSSVRPMQVSENLREFSCHRFKQPKSGVGVLLLFLWAAWMTFFALAANAQNKINTVVGGGTVNPDPLQASSPGPTGVVEDAAGNLYIAPPSSQYIFKLSKSTGQVTLFAGTGYISDHHKPGQALTEPLWSPYSLAADAAGNIYIADTGNNAIKMVDPTGNLQTVVGTSKPCFNQKCNDNGSALKALLWNPQGVVVDPAGNIFIADTADNRVRCVVMAAGGCGTHYAVGTIVNYAGTIGASCPGPLKSCGDGGKANQSLLNMPIGLALDTKGYLYIADSGDHRIRRVGAKHVIDTVAGTGHVCVPSQGCGDGGLATAANLREPRGVAFDSHQNLYIADSEDHVIRVVTRKIIKVMAGNYQRGFSGDGGDPTSAQLDSPSGVYVDSAGDTFVSDSGNQRVRKINAGRPKKINTVLGGGNGGDGGPATGGNPSYSALASPYSVAVDKNNNWYIADTANHRIRVVNTGTQAATFAGVLIQPGDIETVAGTGNADYTGDEIPALSATFNSPFGVSVDSQGNIFVADTGNLRVREVTTDGVIHAFAGDGTECSGGTCGDGGSATSAQLTTPSSLAIDPAGNVFIADAGSQKVREVSNGTISTVAGTGKAGYSGDGGPATLAKLDHPFGVAVDANDNLFIADSVNNRIRCVIGVAGGCLNTTDPVGTIVPYAYDGLKKFKGDGGPATQATRWLPKEVALDAKGNLFIGGGHDAVVQRIDASTGIIITVAGNDKLTYFYGFFGDGFVSTNAHINGNGIAIDSTEMLLLAETGNDRIRNVPLVPVDKLSAVSLNFGNEPVGQTSQPQDVTSLNSGLDDLSFTSFVVAGDFAQTNNCPVKPNPLDPGLSCKLSITFTPTQKGVRHGTVTITDNGYKSPHIIKLVGVGN